MTARVEGGRRSDQPCTCAHRHTDSDCVIHGDIHRRRDSGMTARIEIGRLAAKDLGKWVKLPNGEEGELTHLKHYRLRGPVTQVDVGKWSVCYLSDTLIEVTGTNNKEQDV